MEQLTGRWARELTERELKKALNAGRLDIAESERMGIQFFASRKHLAIIRTRGLGGDTFSVDGGWRYGNLIAFLQDWQEISYVADRVSRWGKHANGS